MRTTSQGPRAGDLLAEAVELTRRLKLPHIRRHLVELVPTARAQRWDHAELVRVLLAEEAAGRDATNLRTRRGRAGFPAGKTLGDWDAAASCIPRPTQDALTSLEWIARRDAYEPRYPWVPVTLYGVEAMTSQVLDRMPTY